MRNVVYCPICKKKLDGRGLKGHMRFFHKKPEREIKKMDLKKIDKLLEKVGPGIPKHVDKVFELIDRLKEIRNRKEELKAKDKSGFFSTDRVVRALREKLDELEAEILKEIEATRPKNQEI